jgi:hypothetical protein
LNFFACCAPRHSTRELLAVVVTPKPQTGTIGELDLNYIIAIDGDRFGLLG